MGWKVPALAVVLWVIALTATVSLSWAVRPTRWAAEQEAMVIRRELAADPDRYRADLPRSLRGLALALEDLGRTAEAEAVRQQADLEPPTGAGSDQS